MSVRDTGEAQPAAGPTSGPTSREGSSPDRHAVQEKDRDDGSDQPLVCDFCGETAPSVRRIALDGEYERLRTPHPTRYACPACSARKERERAARS